LSIGHKKLIIVTASAGYGKTSLYFQSKITLAQGVYVVPEIGFLNMEHYYGMDLGGVVYGGVKWQVDF